MQLGRAATGKLFTIGKLMQKEGRNPGLPLAAPPFLETYRRKLAVFFLFL